MPSTLPAVNYVSFRLTSAQMENGVSVVSLRGDLDPEQTPKVDHELETLQDKGARHLILDLLDVPFLDSSVLGVLLKHSRRIRSSRGTLTLVIDNDATTRGIERVSGRPFPHRLDTVRGRRQRRGGGIVSARPGRSARSSAGGKARTALLLLRPVGAVAASRRIPGSGAAAPRQPQHLPAPPRRRRQARRLRDAAGGDGHAGARHRRRRSRPGTVTNRVGCRQIEELLSPWLR